MYSKDPPSWRGETPANMGFEDSYVARVPLAHVEDTPPKPSFEGSYVAQVHQCRAGRESDRTSLPYSGMMFRR
jgi:hypothetical protein